MVSAAASIAGSIPSTLSAGAGRPSSSSLPSPWPWLSNSQIILHHEPSSTHCNSSAASLISADECAHLDCRPIIDRRQILLSSIGMLTAAAFGNISADKRVAVASEFADMPALRGKDYGKTKMRYPDYTETSSGLQYKDLRIGSGPTPKKGEMVVVDWDGYTIGYYGRIFEARNKTKGGSFEGDDNPFYRFRLGSHETLKPLAFGRANSVDLSGKKEGLSFTGSHKLLIKLKTVPKLTEKVGRSFRDGGSIVIPAFEEAVSGMALGGIRRIIVPPELGYPENDYNKSGPRPTTFSGQRALDFVLGNQGLIDKTLLFDIELLNIISN